MSGVDGFWLGSGFALTGQLGLELLELQQALNLEVLCINNALAMLVNDIDIR